MQYELVVYASNGLAVEPIVTNQEGWFSYIVLPSGCSALGAFQDDLVCDRCEIIIRPEGGHLCDECGRDV